MKRMFASMTVWSLLLFGLWAIPPANANDYRPGQGNPRCRYCGRPLVGMSLATDPLTWLKPSSNNGRSNCCQQPAVRYNSDGTPMAPVPGSEGAPAAATDGAAAALDPNAPGPLSSGAGLGLAGSGARAVQGIGLGDLSPIQRITMRSSVTPVPPPPGGGTVRSRIPLAIARGFKIADNQTPIPVDRCFFTYNYFDYVNNSVNERFGIPISRIRAYRALLGFEKTLFEGKASVGFRLPINTLTADSVGSPATPTRTALGDLGMYTKFIIYENNEKRELLSGGLAMLFPTGPRVFANSPFIETLHNFELQPYLGYQRSWGKFFVIGFEAINVPTAVHDVTVLYNDWAFGYRFYQTEDKTQLLRAVTTNFECHVNIPLNHRDVFNQNDIVGTADIVDLTYGINFQLGDKTLASFGLVTPVTGPRPFSLEALAILNVFSY